MLPAWRLGINALSGRRKRTALLVAAVALAAAMMSAVACGLASVSAGLESRVQATLGSADLRLRHIASARMDRAAVEALLQQPDIERWAVRLRGSIVLGTKGSAEPIVALGIGIDPAREYTMVTPPIQRGRAIERAGEVVLSGDMARDLNVDVGQVLSVVGSDPPVELAVVGVAVQSDVDMLKRYEVTLELGQLQTLSNGPGRISEATAVVRQGIEPQTLADTIQEKAPKDIVVHTTARVTSGIEKSIEANKAGFIAASAMAYLASSLIVLTGLMTSVIERQRELAIMRCIGAERGVLARAQLVIGGFIGAAGAVLGLPLGVSMAALLAALYPDKLPAGLVVPPDGMVIAGVGSLLAGLLGAAWPAISAARTSPLSALTRRSRPITRGAVVWAGLAGLLCVGWQIAIVGIPDDSRIVFWGYVITGLPLMLVGYFLLGVPAASLAGRFVAPSLARALRVPPEILSQSFGSAPFRNGFTAGALMIGMALMTSLWTNGNAILNHWIGGIVFPDAFVADWSGLGAEEVEKIRGLDFVQETSPITLFKTESRAFGLAELKNPPTNFVAFEPDSFFRMTKLDWIAGDPVYARKRLDEGGAVIVAKEFLIAGRGHKIGDSIKVRHRGQTHEFEVVGAVSSPGLDLVGYAFDIGREYADQALGTIFGTRADLKRVFGSDAIHLVQIGYKRDIPDREAEAAIRAALGRGGVIVGSGREIKEGVAKVGKSSLRVASLVALAAMIIGSLGVGNIVLAGIDARRFEFGVLRAVGASPGVLGRLVVGEVLLLCVAAGVLGTLMGIQASYAAVRLYRLMAGLDVHLVPAYNAIALGWVLLFVIALVMTAPLIIRLMRAQVRELLAATRG